MWTIWAGAGVFVVFFSVAEIKQGSEFFCGHFYSISVLLLIKIKINYLHLC